MTSWTNIGFFNNDEDKEKILKTLFEKYENKVVSENPPTIRFPNLNKRERDEFAESVLHEFPVTISNVVFFENSNSADWGTAWVYHVPDDLRKVAVLHKIEGESGLKATDVENELSNIDFYVSKSHYTTELKKSDYVHLWMDSETE